MMVLFSSSRGPGRQDASADGGTHRRGPAGIATPAALLTAAMTTAGGAHGRSASKRHNDSEGKERARPPFPAALLEAVHPSTPVVLPSPLLHRLSTPATA